jgi:hypothetical protein
LVLADAINNDIRITKNEDFCLVYDLPIGIDGLRWKDLVDWWAARSPSDDPERTLYSRLLQSLNSVPEKNFFRLYFEILRDSLKKRFPAIVPQVYLHYDPYIIREQPNGSPLTRQRMDFLLGDYGGLLSAIDTGFIQCKGTLVYDLEKFSTTDT